MININKIIYPFTYADPQNPCFLRGLKISRVKAMFTLYQPLIGQKDPRLSINMYINAQDGRQKAIGLTDFEQNSFTTTTVRFMFGKGFTPNP